MTEAQCRAYARLDSLVGNLPQWAVDGLDVISRIAYPDDLEDVVTVAPMEERLAP